jgi:hypothetical protein
VAKACVESNFGRPTPSSCCLRCCLISTQANASAAW